MSRLVRRYRLYHFPIPLKHLPVLTLNQELGRWERRLDTLAQTRGLPWYSTDGYCR